MGPITRHQAKLPEETAKRPVSLSRFRFCLGSNPTTKRSVSLSRSPPKAPTKEACLIIPLPRSAPPISLNHPAHSPRPLIPSQGSKRPVSLSRSPALPRAPPKCPVLLLFPPFASPHLRPRPAQVPSSKRPVSLSRSPVLPRAPAHPRGLSHYSTPSRSAPPKPSAPPAQLSPIHPRPSSPSQIPLPHRPTLTTPPQHAL